MSEVVRTGSCLCGDVHFDTRGEPRFISNCHCDTCRRAASAASFAWAGFRDDQVIFSGAAPAIFASSPGVTRSFCARCGAQLAYRGERWQGETHLSVCAFKNAKDMARNPISARTKCCLGQNAWALLAKAVECSHAGSHDYCSPTGAAARSAFRALWMSN